MISFLFCCELGPKVLNNKKHKFPAPAVTTESETKPVQS